MRKKNKSSSPNKSPYAGIPFDNIIEEGDENENDFIDKKKESSQSIATKKEKTTKNNKKKDNKSKKGKIL